jgi:hypothetical protein
VRFSFYRALRISVMLVGLVGLVDMGAIAVHCLWPAVTPLPVMSLVYPRWLGPPYERDERGAFELFVNASCKDLVSASELVLPADPFRVSHVRKALDACWTERFLPVWNENLPRA